MQWAKEKVQKTNTYLQTNTQKTNDWTTLTKITTRREVRYLGGVGSSCSTNDTRRVSLRQISGCK